MNYMRTFTFAISKGGVGKSLLTANIGLAIAQRRKKVVLVEGDPNKPLLAIFGLKPNPNNPKLDDVVKKDLRIEDAILPTAYEHLFVIPSGISLEGYFDIDPVLFARKLLTTDADFMFIDVPFPLGKAAFLSLGICEYFAMILTEDEFSLCVESAIDTNRLGKFFLNCVPVGFVINRIKTPKRFTEEFVHDLEKLLRVPCMAKILEDERVSKSYGGVGSRKAFLAYAELPENNFKESIDKIASAIVEAKLPPSVKKDVPKFLDEITKPLRHQ